MLTGSGFLVQPERKMIIGINEFINNWYIDYPYIPILRRSWIWITPSGFLIFYQSKQKGW